MFILHLHNYLIVYKINILTHSLHNYERNWKRYNENQNHAKI